jgi:uncharacterized protein with GYD domain
MLGTVAGGCKFAVISLAIASLEVCKACSSQPLRNRTDQQIGKSDMAIYMYQAAYTAESWAAQMKNPQNRVESIGRQACETVGGNFIGGWLCFGDYDIVIIADVPDNESMTAIALAISAGGAVKSSKTTVLMTGEQGVAALEKANTVAEAYSPAR